MITFENGGRLVQSLGELPNLRDSKRLFADFETTSHDRKKKSTNPWHDCYIAGVGVTADDAPGAWYVPVGHHVGENLPFDNVMDWLNDTLQSVESWCNHHVKYDAHVAANCGGITKLPALECTLDLAKIIDSDRVTHGGYRLEDLAKAWFHEDINKYWEAMYPYLEGDHGNKDYGWVPPDIMAPYCCQDVITNRRLYKFIDARCPEQCRRVWRNEISLMTMLWEMERVGLQVNETELAAKELELYIKLLTLETKMEQIVGRPFRAHVNADCFDVLCNQFGLPVIAWTEDKDDEDDPEEEQPGNPSFDKHALAKYLVRPDAPPGLLPLMIEYREANTLNNFFVKKYRASHISGILHPSHNPTVRTGRMSVKDPNSQQLNEEARALIHPRLGYVFLSCDASQIEFRLIVHYIKDWNAISAYAKNPDTDFHAWVASLNEIERDPAKTLNFMMAFGGGRKKTVKTLSHIPGLVKRLAEKVKHLPPVEQGKAFDALCIREADTTYDTYHTNLPTLKKTSRRAARSCENVGYVFNLLGRRRHLPAHKSHIAFNTIMQGSAADLIKEKMLQLRDRVKPLGVDFCAQVHDELLMEVPEKIIDDPSLQREVLGVLEDPHDYGLRVPLRFTWGVGRNNWLEAKKAGKLIHWKSI